MASNGTKFVVCVSNDGCDDLTVWKLYRVLADESAAEENYLRIIDNSGEDYLYPAQRFVAVNVPAESEQALRTAAGGI